MKKIALSTSLAAATLLGGIFISNALYAQSFTQTFSLANHTAPTTTQPNVESYMLQPGDIVSLNLQSVKANTCVATQLYVGRSTINKDASYKIAYATTINEGGNAGTLTVASAGGLADLPKACTKKSSSGNTSTSNMTVILANSGTTAVSLSFYKLTLTQNK